MMECMAAVSVVANCSWYFQHIDMSRPEQNYWTLILVYIEYTLKIYDTYIAGGWTGA